MSHTQTTQNPWCKEVMTCLAMSCICTIPAMEIVFYTTVLLRRDSEVYKMKLSIIKDHHHGKYKVNSNKKTTKMCAYTK